VTAPAVQHPSSPVVTGMEHPPGTVELVTCKVSAGFSGATAECDYELTWGAYRLVSSRFSANDVWRPASVPLPDGDQVKETASIMCLNVTGNQPSLVKCFQTRDEFVRFIEFYLRGRIIDSVLSLP